MIHSLTGKAPFEIVEGAMKVPPFLSTKDKIFEADEYTRDLDTAFAKVRETLQNTQELRKKAADRHQRDLKLKENDWVLLRFEKARLRKKKRKERLYPKLNMRYYGPFQITERIHDVSFRLRLPETWKVHNAFHVSLLKPFKGDVPDDGEPDEQPEVEENEKILVSEQILAHKNMKKGLSLKSQELTAIFLAVRLYCSFVMEYDIHTLLDTATLITTCWVVYMMRYRVKSTYLADLDNFPLYLLAIPCAVLALVIHPTTSHYFVNRILWAFCVYLEAVSVLPQLRVMQNTRVVETFTAHYVFALGIARFFSCAHWVLQKGVPYGQPGMPNAQQYANAENVAENQQIGDENQPHEVAIDAPQVEEQNYGENQLVDAMQPR
ncbi:hypothetical protein L7F22_014932 [Adiantum nelumboides]|nr:hypothetical protein [Adiantum nelumboides]